MSLLPRHRSWRLPWSEGRRRRRHQNVDVARRYPDLEPAFLPLYETCKHATMTSVERLYALYKTVEYVVRNDIAGDFVECGVWRGGSVMMMALALQKFGDTGRRIRCFDTFEGMPTPGDADIRHDTGERAADIMAVTERDENAVIWALAPLEQVQRNVASTGYPADRITYHKGKVEETLPAQAPERIALLRLDTDWYEFDEARAGPSLSAAGRGRRADRRRLRLLARIAGCDRRILCRRRAVTAPDPRRRHRPDGREAGLTSENPLRHELWGRGCRA